MSDIRTKTNPSESVRKLNPKLFAQAAGLTVGADEVATVINDICGNPAVVTVTKKRVRQSSKPLLNKLEGEWLKYHQPSIGTAIRPQSLRFKLGNGIWYKPDFTYTVDKQPVAVEVKGERAFRGGFENLKVAAALYPEWDWLLFWKVDGQWKIQRILP